MKLMFTVVIYSTKSSCQKDGHLKTTMSTRRLASQKRKPLNSTKGKLTKPLTTLPLRKSSTHISEASVEPCNDEDDPEGT